MSEPDAPTPDDDISAIDAAMPEPAETAEGAAHAAFIERHEEALAAQRASSIAAARRRGGVAGAAMAGAMLAVSEIVEGPPKDDAPVTVEASGDPNDLDKDGIDVQVGDVDVSAPPLERLDPVSSKQAKPPTR
jgi:hypothetical protein